MPETSKIMTPLQYEGAQLKKAKSIRESSSYN